MVDAQNDDLVAVVVYPVQNAIGAAACGVDAGQVATQRPADAAYKSDDVVRGVDAVRSLRS